MENQTKQVSVSQAEVTPAAKSTDQELSAMEKGMVHQGLSMNGGGKVRPTGLRLVLSILAGLIIALGLFISLVFVSTINACFKGSCPDPDFLQDSSILWAPALSLIITVPIARIIRKI